MAGKKRKAEAKAALPVKKTQSSSKSSQRIKPSVELVEVSSDSDEQPRLRGALRGLNPNNMLPTPKNSIEDSDDQGDDEREANGDKENRRMTRGSRYGRAVARENYDMKWHPMDKVTRPKAAAKRTSGSPFRARDGDTSDASLPSSAQGSDDEESDADHRSDLEELPARTPNPRATRHSARTEANKAVNYSRKHHPQDYGLPGHQNKAKRLRRSGAKRKYSSSKRSSLETQACQGESEGQVVGDSDDEQDDMELELKQPSKPRKKLRTLSDDRSSSPQKSMRKDRSSKTSKATKTTVQSESLLETMPDEDVATYLDDAYGAVDNQQPNATSDNVEAVRSLNGVVDDAQASSSSSRELSRIAAKQRRPIAGLNMLASDDETEEDPQEVADRLQSQYSYRTHDLASTRANEDEEPAADSDDNHEDERPHNQGEDDEHTTMFQSRSLSSIGEGRHSAQRNGDRAMQPPTSTSNPPLLARFGSIVAADIQRATRKESSSSTMQASTRVESSSTVKASSRVNSRTERGRFQLNSGEIEDVKADEESHDGDKTEEVPILDALSASIERNRHSKSQRTGAGSLAPEQQGSIDVHSAKAQARPDQPISPVGSLEEGGISQPTPPNVERAPGAVDMSSATGTVNEVKIARESSRVSLQSPESTPDRSDTQVRPSQLQRSQKDVLFSSDPNESPTRDVDSADAVPSTDPDSPSRFLSEHT